MNATFENSSLSDANDQPTPGPVERVFYHHGQITVTSQWVLVRRHRYPVRGMRHICIVKGPHSTMTVVAMVVAVAMAVGVIEISNHLDVEGWAGAVAIATPLVTVVIVGLLGRRRRNVLTARFDGTNVPIVFDERPCTLARIARAIRLARASRGGEPSTIAKGTNPPSVALLRHMWNQQNYGV